MEKLRNIFQQHVDGSTLNVDHLVKQRLPLLFSIASLYLNDEQITVSKSKSCIYYVILWCRIFNILI